ncbi:uncharacterized protein CDAR_271661 [Caerostris darwini]|uniref:Uncharacterized protein n=1 Tax=Caerostris darwini TaxID=1538125 RepID=A0AAV4T734_9ARAC|nr:uncharacterized protein CDAR_271661 [Caerostris darwini]
MRPRCFLNRLRLDPDIGLVVVVLVWRQVASRSKGVLGIQAGYLSSVAAIELQEHIVSVLAIDTCLPVPIMLTSTWLPAPLLPIFPISGTATTWADAL